MRFAKEAESFRFHNATTVTFRKLKDEVIQGYVNSHEPLSVMQEKEKNS